MINSENVLNSAQLEAEIKHFVHDFCLDKHDIHMYETIRLLDTFGKELLSEMK